MSQFTDNRVLIVKCFTHSESSQVQKSRHEVRSYDMLVCRENRPS